MSLHSTRRHLLTAALVLWAAPRTAAAIGPTSEFRIARLRLPGLGESRQSGLVALAADVRIKTTVPIALDVADLSLTDPRLFRYPFCVVIGDREPNPLSESELSRLKTYLEAGGTLFVDCVGPTQPSEAFDTWFRAQIAKLFPQGGLARIPSEHVLYRAFFKIDYPAGRLIAESFLEGVYLGGRLALVYSRNDLSGAWSRDSFGQWEYDVLPGGDVQRMTAMKMGVNLVEYVLCQEYKDDQVHTDYLLRKRKWRIEVPAEPR